MLKNPLAVLCIGLSLLAATGARAEYQPKAERVAENVFAIVGPLGQRGTDNDGLNATFGFIVTPSGVILIDSGASRLGAKKLAAAISAVTDQPVRWVINTGGQDHRWLGNDFFAGEGAEIIAMSRTVAGQIRNGSQQLDNLARFLGDRLAGTRALPAGTALSGDQATVERGGETLTVRYTDAHFPGDAMVILARHGVAFTGDLVYVDRLLGVLPMSSVRQGQRAFHALAALKPVHVVPGHGRVCDLAKARRDTGDYYDFLVNTIGTAAREMEPLDAVLDRHADAPAFRHLDHFKDLHRANMNRAFTELEAQ